mgnify:CR=1 FL=1
MKKKKLVMPSNYVVLDEEELMRNTSGWYINVSERKFYLLPKDIEACEKAVNSILKTLGIEQFNVDFSSYFNADANVRNGISFQITDNSLSFSLNLTEEEKKLAAANTFSL